MFVIYFIITSLNSETIGDIVVDICRVILVYNTGLIFKAVSSPVFTGGDEISLPYAERVKYFFCHRAD